MRILFGSLCCMIIYAPFCVADEFTPDDAHISCMDAAYTAISDNSYVLDVRRSIAKQSGMTTSSFTETSFSNVVAATIAVMEDKIAAGSVAEGVEPFDTYLSLRSDISEHPVISAFHNTNHVPPSAEVLNNFSSGVEDARIEPRGASDALSALIKDLAMSRIAAVANCKGRYAHIFERYPEDFIKNEANQLAAAYYAARDGAEAVQLRESIEIKIETALLEGRRSEYESCTVENHFFRWGLGATDTFVTLGFEENPFSRLIGSSTSESVMSEVSNISALFTVAYSLVGSENGIPTDAQVHANDETLRELAILNATTALTTGESELGLRAERSWSRIQECKALMRTDPHLRSITNSR